MKKVCVHVILLLLLLGGCKTSKIPPDVFVRKLYSSAGNFIQYYSGNLPVILSAPHGGTAKPDSLPDRSCAGCVTTADLNTTELAMLIDSFITVKTGCYAHLVLSNLHRVKLDANRNLPEAIDGNAITKSFYDKYHFFMQAASDSVKKKFKKGLVIDLHGHGHTIQRLEIGYLLSEKILRLSDVNLLPFKDSSSIRHLATQSGAGFISLLRGEKALGTLLAAKGFPAVPSKQIPAPKSGEPYFEGGFITATYGSVNKGTIDAIQVETNLTGVRDSDTARRTFAAVFADIIINYVEEQYFNKKIQFSCK
jgi:N-formylglutamate amidohydrolase